MDKYLLFAKDQLSEWYVFTLSNTFYAAALAGSVFIATAILYSIRIAILKRGKNVAEKKASETLHTAQQQLQHTQEELLTTLELLEQAQQGTQQAQQEAQNEAQRVLSIEQLVYQRNQQIAGIIQTIATSFDLGERPLLATEDMKADALWQQHEKVVSVLIERLRSEQKAKAELQQAVQAETAKVVEKDKQFEILQATISSHAELLAKLEQALRQQNEKIALQGDNQTALSESLEKYRADALSSPRAETVKPVEIPPPSKPVEPAPQPTAQVEPQPIVPVEPAPQAQPQPIVHIEPEPVQAEAPSIAVAEEKPAVPVYAEPTPIAAQQAITESAPVVSETIESDLPDIDFSVPEEIAAVESDSEPKSASEKNSLGKIKNLFGKKTPKVKTEPQWAAEKAGDNLTDAAPKQPDGIAEEPKKAAGKLKGLYSKFKSFDK